jgi:8-hydroxy-5-deazaflavin:NADPH oxidoreductase
LKIGIIGTGNMGRVLGGLWSTKGHQVMFGARNTEAALQARELAEAAGGRDLAVGSNAEAAAFGDVLFYSPRGADPSTVVSDTSVFAGKTVIDPNNWPIPKDFRFDPIQVSHAEQLQQCLPQSFVVKAFNTMAQEVFEADPEALHDAKVSVFLAGNNSDALSATSELCRDLNLSPLIVGPLYMAREIESAGNLIRSVIAKKGVMATLSVSVLPLAKEKRFGPRQPSTLPESDKRIT